MSETMNETTASHDKDQCGSGSSEVFCPFCFVAKKVRSTRKSRSGFFSHFYNAQIEMLKAFKSLIDQQITTLEERRGEPAGERKATRIEVE